MPRLSLPNLVVAFLLHGKAMSLDVIARVSVVEGIAGVKPGTWMRNVVPEKEIAEVFGLEVKATPNRTPHQPAEPLASSSVVAHRWRWSSS